MMENAVHQTYTARAPGVHRFVMAAVLLGTAQLTFAVTATPAEAQEQTFALPAGCDAFLTVQSTSCTVHHHFTCEGDPEGHKRRVSFDEIAMTYLGTTDAETQWIGSFHPASRHSEALEPNPVDPASLTELIETGRDSYDFRTFSDQVGTTRYTGVDELTGKVVTIDNVTLQETSYQITAYGEDGSELWSAQGNEFISSDWRMFLAGTGTVKNGATSFEKDDRPVEFIYPGEPGFLSINPKHGCGVVMSSLEVSP